jgi:hypothetical protein
MKYQYVGALKGNFPQGVFPCYQLNIEAGSVGTSLLKEHGYIHILALPEEIGPPLK